MTSLLIIADDFTGALDTGVQFAKKGIHARVVTGSTDFIRSLDDSCEVLVIDAETRHLPFEKACRIIEEIIDSVQHLNIRYYYKKTDSALRGNVGAELEALKKKCCAERLFFLPAYPDVARTVRGGMLYVDGVPVSESVFAKDPFEPVRESVIAELLGSETAVPIINAPAIRDRSELPEENGIIVFDSESNEDLKRIGKILSDMDLLSVTAGCAGFASVLTDLLPLQRSLLQPASLKEEMLVVCGSVNPISVAQMNRAEENGFIRVRLSPAQKLDPDHWESEAGIREIAGIRSAFRTCGYRILDANDADDNRPTKEEMEKRGISTEEARKRIAASIGKLCAHLLEKDDFGTLFVTGGDTLLNCMNQMDVHELEPVCELSAGVVLSKLPGSRSDRFVISKSGGFGDACLLCALKDKLNKQEENEIC